MVRAMTFQRCQSRRSITMSLTHDRCVSLSQTDCQGTPSKRVDVFLLLRLTFTLLAVIREHASEDYTDVLRGHVVGTSCPVAFLKVKLCQGISRSGENWGQRDGGVRAASRTQHKGLGM